MFGPGVRTNYELFTPSIVNARTPAIDIKWTRKKSSTQIKSKTIKAQKNKTISLSSIGKRLRDSANYFKSRFKKKNESNAPSCLCPFDYNYKELKDAKNNCLHKSYSTVSNTSLSSIEAEEQFITTLESDSINSKKNLSKNPIICTSSSLPSKQNHCIDKKAIFLYNMKDLSKSPSSTDLRKPKPQSHWIVFWSRKGPYLKTLKHVHSEQIARLQAKNQHECDLLEDIRNFTKQRSVIEKTYAEALLKISSAYLNKKIPSIPDLRDDDDEEKWNVWNVWRTVLEENEKLARARLAAVEVFTQQITDDAKTIRQVKLQASRKCLEQLQVVQKELQITVSDLDRNKKFYFEEEHLAHDARVKATDAEEKLKKKKGSIFSSFTSLQRSSVKFSTKKEACEEKSTGARNDYIISLAQANAHQDRYFNYDMDSCLRTLESDVYDKLKEYLTVLGRTELLTCSAAQNSFTKIRDQAQMLSRDYNVMCCVQYYPVLKQHIRYPFDACDGDHCRKITSEHISTAMLTREAKNWVGKIVKQVKIIKENQRKLRILQELKDQGNKADPDDPNGPDLDTKIDDLKENIRKAETEKVKAEAVIECFRDGGINVDEWMKDIETFSVTLDIPRSGSSASLKTDTSGDHQNKTEAFYDSDSQESPSPFQKMKEVKEAPPPPAESPEPTEIDIDSRVEQERKRLESITWDDPTKVDWGDEHNAEPSHSPPQSETPPRDRSDSWPHDTGAEPGITKCVALYSYSAQNPDELTILENEHLDLIGEGDGDGWVRARNYKGEEGYVPQNYVEVEGNQQIAGYPLQPQISFSSVDYHVTHDTSATEDDHTTMEDYSSAAPAQPGFSNGYPETMDNEEYYNQNLPEEMPTHTAPTTVSSGLTTPFINECRGEEGSFCRALYDYEATAPEELSFYEGQIIRIISFNPHDEDDGWWEGEYDGNTGLFPSIVADECTWDGNPIESPDDDIGIEEDEDLSESGINPPSFPPPDAPANLQPPETVVTQPTPEIETTSVNEEELQREDSVETPCTVAEASAFEMELNTDQQQKYNTQFGAGGGDSPEHDEIKILVTEVPPEEPTDLSLSDNADAGLEVTQIVITAATPMSEEHKKFPEEPILEEEEEEDLPELEKPTDEDDRKDTNTVDSEPQVYDSPNDVEQDIEAFADFSNAEFSFNADNEPEEPALSKNPTIEESSESVSVQSTSELQQSNIEPKKASLEIEDYEARLLRGESGDSTSPVTPEELDVKNLAKLESLKESEA